jgi:Rps23 Pro-64 3,4-dihydroxylase Tpa1-like proline 4-hydroxylase
MATRLQWQSGVLDRFDTWIRGNGDSFTSAEPFPHAVIDGLFEEDVLDAVIQEFPAADDPHWQVSRDEGIQIKLRSNWKGEPDIPTSVRDVVHFLNSGQFLLRLTALTGIEHLISDPYYTGGGLNCILPGGLLDVHCDGNWHDAMAIHRRLNLILFLNEQWDPSWHGALEFWDREMSGCVKAIEPDMNRVLVFETHDYSFHGHPHPLTCPHHRMRRSLILYYYTSVPRPPEQVRDAEPHRALWRKKSLLPLSK